MNNNKVSTSAESVGKYVPPKMWKDLTIDEKIERMREQVKHFDYRVLHLQRTVNQLMNDLRNHAHLDGKVVKDIKTNEFDEIGVKKTNPEAEIKGEVYF